MRPLVLHGHTRPVTHVEFNREGDLLFTTGKDAMVNCWRLSTGERLGTYEGHKGVVWYCNVDQSTTRLATGSGDESMCVWEVETGKLLDRFMFETPVRCVDWDATSRSVMAVTDNIRGINPHVYLTKWDEENHKIVQGLDVPQITSKVTCAKWGPMNRFIAICGEDGSLRIFDPETQQYLSEKRLHKKSVCQVSFDKYGLLMITASKDGSAKLFDTRSFNLIKTYETGRPVNSAAISPIKDHVLLGGGQEASQVTTRRVDNSQFKTILFDMVHEEEVGRIAGPFGPTHSVTFSPDGTSLATGAEDGFVRYYPFDKSYFASAPDTKRK